MIGCFRTCVRKQLIIALYFESKNELQFYNLEARCRACLAARRGHIRLSWTPYPLCFRQHFRMKYMGSPIFGCAYFCIHSHLKCGDPHCSTKHPHSKCGDVKDPHPRDPHCIHILSVKVHIIFTSQVVWIL